MVLHPSLTTPLFFPQAHSELHYADWLYYGIMLAMALYNLLLFFLTKERSYLYLSLATFFIGFNDFIHTGFAFQFLWPATPMLNRYTFWFFTYVAVFWVIIFSRNFLAIPRVLPRIDKVFLVLTGIALVNITSKAWFNNPLTHAFGIYASLLTVFIIMLTALYAWLFKKNRNAKLYLLTMSTAAIGIIFDLLRIETAFINDRTGIALLMLLFSIVLADKINAAKREKLQAQKEALRVQEEAAQELATLNQEITHLNINLENKVKERTIALEQSCNDYEKANKELWQEIGQRKQAEEQIRHLAYHDTLTGLPNRKLLYEQFTQETARATRNKKLLMIMFLDLDDFKAVNDQYGHETGDYLLAAIARLLKSTLRESDIIARLGGDEFIILLPDMVAVEDAERVAVKIFKALQPPIPINGQKFFIEVSIGISIFPKDGSEQRTLIRKADKAMYMAKKELGNRYQVYTNSDTFSP